MITDIVEGIELVLNEKEIHDHKISFSHEGDDYIINIKTTDYYYNGRLKSNGELSIYKYDSDGDYENKSLIEDATNTNTVDVIEAFIE